MRTKGEMEASVAEALVRFETDYMGRGPKEARAHIIENMVLVRLSEVLTPAERQLTKSPEGVELIKKMRATLIERAKPLLAQVVGDITGSKIHDLRTDIGAGSGERLLWFTLDRDLERSLPRKKPT